MSWKKFLFNTPDNDELRKQLQDALAVVNKLIEENKSDKRSIVTIELPSFSSILQNYFQGPDEWSGGQLLEVQTISLKEKVDNSTIKFLQKIFKKEIAEGAIPGTPSSYPENEIGFIANKEGYFALSLPYLETPLGMNRTAIESALNAVRSNLDTTLEHMPKSKNSRSL